MNKSELIDSVADRAGISKKQAGEVVNGLLDTITQELKNGGEVTLVGFGSFSVKRREERTGRNPSSGQEIIIPAANTPHFKAGKTLKDDVN